MKIVIFFPEYLGDYFFLVPFIHEIKKKYKTAQIDIYTTKTIIEIVRFHPAISNAYIIPDLEKDGKLRIREAWVFSKLIRSKKYDLGYFTNPCLYWVCLFGRVKLVIKEHYGVFSKFFTKGTPRKALRNKFKHSIVRHLDNLAHFFVEAITLQDYHYNLGIPENVLKIPEEIVVDGEYALVCPDAHSCNNYDEKFYVQVIEYLLELNLNVVVVGLKDIYSLDKYFGSKEKFYYFIGKTTLYNLIGLIKNCGLFIGIDSGPAQIAVCFKKRTVMLFPPKGVWPLARGFDNDFVFTYKIPSVKSRCRLVCQNYSACSKDLCKMDYDVKDVKKLIGLVLESKERSWEEKQADSFKQTIKVLVIFPDNGSSDLRGYFRAMIDAGYDIVVWEGVKQKNIFDFYKFLKENRIMMVHYIGDELPVKYKIINLFCRFSERLYIAFYASKKIGVSHKEQYELYAQKIIQ
jgi:ADP-heptose:LPS heptosyltransferase